MKEVRDIMGMPITVEVVGARAARSVLDEVFAYFTYVDEIFSTYKTESEISRINRGELSLETACADVQSVYEAANQTCKETDGYFNHRTPDGTIDPSGIVKGWSIQKAAALLKERGVENFCIDAGGDIQTNGVNTDGTQWSVGIRHPFQTDHIAKVVYPHGKGVATSGTYLRGEHIYDPTTGAPVVTPFISMTLIGPNIYDADRFATAAFAMGKRGMHFIEMLSGYEGYAITHDMQAQVTSGFNEYTKS
ncbi:MAG TPA: FAD:protein FMN transferase [Candidatus Kaiserbacteria bacterium]|nr:FAD:protein FMN transferase [Candidatus Kaiserbacteria bacterium]